MATRQVYFYIGTKEQYEAAEHDSDSLYWVSDTQELYKGDVLYAKGLEATEEANGLMSAEDKAIVNKFKDSGALDLVAVDKSVVVGSDAEGNTTVGVQISGVADNAITLEEDGLCVDVSGKVDTKIKNTDGSTALIQNEETGGGAKFWHSDGSEVFVGVNNGGLEGLMAQIYADEEVDGKWIGTRINVYHDHIYYIDKDKREAGVSNNDPDCEIATVGDLAAVSGLIWQDM